MALGLIECFGFVTSVVVADLCAKTADVRIVALDKNKPLAGDDAEVPLIMVVKLAGEVAAVQQAVDAGVAEAKKRGMYVTHYVIGREEDDTKKLAARCDVGKDKFNQPRKGS